MTTTKFNFAIGATLALGMLAAATSWSSLRHEVQPAAMVSERDAEVSGRDAEFNLAAAGLDGQLQTLRRLEKEMLRGGSEDKFKALRQRWDESRSRADRLVASARDAAHTKEQRVRIDRKSTRLNSSHLGISYAV